MGYRFRQIHRRMGVQDNAPLGAAGDFLHQLGGFQVAFGGNAAPVEAGAPQHAFFKHGGSASQLGGLDRGHIARRTAADHRDVVLLSHNLISQMSY